MTSQYLPPDAQAETVAAPVENSAQPVQSAAAQACCCSSEICRSQGCQIVAAAAGNVQNASPSALTPDPLLVQALEALRGMVGGTCPDCKGWGEVAYFGEMVRCKCNGDYRHQPGAASRATAAAILAQAKERGL